MNVGQIVKFREVLEAGDEVARFKVVELRGDRVLVEDANAARDWSITPTFVYAAAELVEA